MTVEWRLSLPYVTAEIEYRGPQGKIKDVLAQLRSLEDSVCVSSDAIRLQIQKISRENQP